MVAFEKSDKRLQGYAVLEEHDLYANFLMLRTNPRMEKFAINAALVDGILQLYRAKLSRDFYICDGSRVIRHETAFQDYLEKYFTFRKAYCRLHLKYRTPLSIIVKFLYPFRYFIFSSSIKSKLMAILRMEEIQRNFD